MWQESPPKKRAPARLQEKSQVGKPVVKLPSQKLSLRYQPPPLQWKMERQVTLKGQTSNGSPISWKSQKSSVAEIDENGKISAKKPGETTITAKADGTKKTCHVTVKKPKVTLNYTSASLVPQSDTSSDGKSVLREKGNMEVAEKKCSHRHQPGKSHGNKTWYNKNPGID